MTVDYLELNKVTPPVFAAVPNIVTMLECLRIKLGTYHCVLDLANAFFGVDIAPESQDHFTFMWECRQ